MPCEGGVDGGVTTHAGAAGTRATAGGAGQADRYSSRQQLLAARMVRYWMAMRYDKADRESEVVVSSGRSACSTSRSVCVVVTPVRESVTASAKPSAGVAVMRVSPSASAFCGAAWAASRWMMNAVATTAMRTTDKTEVRVMLLRLMADTLRKDVWSERRISV